MPAPLYFLRKITYFRFVLGRFCRSCIATSLKNNKWTCPYCRAYLPSEGVPATDVAKRMKSEYQKCTECDTPVRDPLSACAQGYWTAEKIVTGKSFHLCLWLYPTPSFSGLWSLPLPCLLSKFVWVGCCELGTRLLTSPHFSDKCFHQPPTSAPFPSLP